MYFVSYTDVLFYTPEAFISSPSKSALYNLHAKIFILIELLLVSLGSIITLCAHID